MATIKIKELPIKRLSDINPTDLMVIEDKIDTKQITVEDLQLFFSSDNKIKALKEMLEKEISELEDTFRNEIKALNREDKDFANKLEDLYNDHENTKARLGNLIEKVVDIENLLNATIDRVEKNEIAISNLQDFTKLLRTDLDKAITDIANNAKQIESIKEKDEEQDARFDFNEELMKEFRDEYKQKMDEIDKEVSENKDTAKAYSDQLYDQIMEYIDFYHHLHEDPPNFDDPNWADTQQMNLVFKVGMIYETVDDNFNPKENLPGTWEYVGDTNVYDTAGEIVLVKHTYIRVE